MSRTGDAVIDAMNAAAERGEEQHRRIAVLSAYVLVIGIIVGGACYLASIQCYKLAFFALFVAGCSRVSTR